MRIYLVVVALLSTGLPVLAQAESVVEIESRGQKVRALLVKPAKPVGSVILLAGGHGRLDIGADGTIGWGAGNQLVRTRAAYAQAGFVTLVPDVALDLKTGEGVVSGYRFSPPLARDIGAMVTYLRGIKPPVVIVATSRGAISGAYAVSKAPGAERPDALVLTAPMAMKTEGQPSIQQALADDPKGLMLPLLVVAHRKDSCAYTLPASAEAFRQWHARAGGKLDLVFLDGPQGRGDPCEARAAHGFEGIDDQVVATVTGWIRKTVVR